MRNVPGVLQHTEGADQIVGVLRETLLSRRTIDVERFKTPVAFKAPAFPSRGKEVRGSVGEGVVEFFARQPGHHASGRASRSSTDLQDAQGLGSVLRSDARDERSNRRVSPLHVGSVPVHPFGNLLTAVGEQQFVGWDSA